MKRKAKERMFEKEITEVSSREDLNVVWARWLTKQSADNRGISERIKKGEFDLVAESCVRGVIATLADNQYLIDQELRKKEKKRDFTAIMEAEENRDLILSLLEVQTLDANKIAEFEKNVKTLEGFGYDFIERPGPLIMQIQAGLQNFRKKEYIKNLNEDVCDANKGIGNTCTTEEIQAVDRELILGYSTKKIEAENDEELEKLYDLFQKIFESTVAYEKSGGSTTVLKQLLHYIDPRQQYSSGKKEACITTVPYNVLQKYIKLGFSSSQKTKESNGIYRPNIAAVKNISDLRDLVDNKDQLKDSLLGALEIQFVYDRDEAQAIAKFAQEQKLIVLDIYKPSPTEWKPYDVGIADINGMKDITITVHMPGSIRKEGEVLQNIPVQTLTGPALFISNIKGVIETAFGTPSGPQEQLLFNLISNPDLIPLLKKFDVPDYDQASKLEKLVIVARAILENDEAILLKVVAESEEKFRELFYQFSGKDSFLDKGELISLPGAGRIGINILAQYFYELENQGVEEKKEVRYLTYKPAWPYAQVLGTGVATIDHIEAGKSYLPQNDVLLTLFNLIRNKFTLKKGGLRKFSLNLIKRALQDDVIELPKDEILEVVLNFVISKNSVPSADDIDDFIKYRDELEYRLDVKFGEDYLPDPIKLDETLLKTNNNLDTAIHVVILNYPNNPSGVVPEKERLKAIYRVCAKHNVRVINDNSYMNVVSDRKVLANSYLHSFELMDEVIKEAEINGDPNLEKLKEWKDTHLYETNALTKTVNQPGSRVGFVGTKDKKALEYLKKLASHEFDGVQNYMALAYFNNFADDPEAVRKLHDPLVCKTISERIDITTKVIENEDKVNCVVPEGAFYVNVDFREYIDPDGEQKKFLDSTWFAGGKIGLIISEYFGVTVFPNDRMNGKKGVFRFGLGGPMEDPEEFAKITRIAIRRIKAYIEIARELYRRKMDGSREDDWNDDAITDVINYFCPRNLKDDEFVYAKST